MPRIHSPQFFLLPVRSPRMCGTVGTLTLCYSFSLHLTGSVAIHNWSGAMWRNIKTDWSEAILQKLLWGRKREWRWRLREGIQGYNSMVEDIKHHEKDDEVPLNPLIIRYYIHLNVCCWAEFHFIYILMNIWLLWFSWEF